MSVRPLLFVFALLAVGPGCTGSARTTPVLPSALHAQPLYSAILTGPDANIWYIDENAAGLVRMSVSGSIHQFPLTGVGANVVSMTVGADKKFYILNESSNIVRDVVRGGRYHSDFQRGRHRD
jgi:hypothetical protein